MNNYFYNSLNRYDKCDLLTEASYGIDSEHPVTFDNVINTLTRNKIWSILSSSENIVFEFNSLKDATVQEIDKNKNVSPEPFLTIRGILSQVLSAFLKSKENSPLESLNQTLGCC